MEKLNLNFSGGDNVVKSICWIMSYLSWLLLVASGWASLKWLVQTPYKYDYDFLINPDPDNIKWGWTIWGFFALRTVEYGSRDKDPLKEEYYPLQMQVSLYYICFILALIVITGGCFVFFYKTICKKDDQVINGMMGQFSKFHFFPLLCASALFIIGECVDQDLDDAGGFYDHFKKMYIAGLVFSIIGLASFIFIYIMTDLNTDWWVLLLLKKGAFSCLIILIWYSLCYDIYYVHFFDKREDGEAPFDNPNSEKMWDWKKGCGLAFSIIFGVGSLAFSFVFKDLVACVMNLLIYIGLTVAYFRLEKEKRKHKDANKNGDGIVDIIMLVLSVAVIVLLLIKYRENCMKS